MRTISLDWDNAIFLNIINVIEDKFDNDEMLCEPVGKTRNWTETVTSAPGLQS